jgi:condensation domain-containing protein
MQYSELDDYEMLAGSLTVWRPRTDWDDECLDDRPLAPQHERYVSAHPPEQGGDWIGTVFEIHQPYDQETMRRALSQWHQRHEAFRTTARDAGSAWQRLVAQPEAIDVVPHWDGVYSTGAATSERLQQLFSESIHPHNWPHLIVTTITPPTMTSERPRFQVVFAADHSVMDAYSQVLAVTELNELYAEAMAGPGAPEPSPEVASYVDFSAYERDLATASPHGDTLKRWRQFLGLGEPQFPPFPLDLGGSVEGRAQRQCSINREFLPLDLTNLVHGAAKSRGHGMQTAVLCALAEATRRTSGSRELKFVMPMHTRTADYLQSMGWFVGLSPVTIPLDLDAHEGLDPIGALLERCAAATENVRRDAAVPYPGIEDQLGVNSTPRFVISFVDIRFVPGEDQFDAVRARALRSPATSDDEFYLWVVRAGSGLNISARFPSNPVARESFETYMATVHDVLLEVAGVAQFDAAGAEDELAA